MNAHPSVTKPSPALNRDRPTRRKTGRKIGGWIGLLAFWAIPHVIMAADGKESRPPGIDSALAFIEYLARSYPQTTRDTEAHENGHHIKGVVPYVKVVVPTHPLLEPYVEKAVGFGKTLEASISTMHDAAQAPGNARLVAPVAGTYEFMGNIGFSAMGPVTFRYYAVVRKNGDLQQEVARDEFTHFTHFRELKVNGTVELEEGDYLQIHVFQNSGETLRIRAEFQMWRIENPSPRT